MGKPFLLLRIRKGLGRVEAVDPERILVPGVAGQVVVDRPRPDARMVSDAVDPVPDVPLVGGAHGRLAEAGENGAEKNDRGAHFPHQLLRDPAPAERRRVHMEVLALPVGAAAQIPQDFNGRVHVLQAGTAFDDAGLAG